MRVSIIIEWENTRLNGMARGWQMLDVLAEQWKSVATHDYPVSLPSESSDFLQQLDQRAELLIVSGDAPDAEFEQDVKRRVPADQFDLRVLTSEEKGYHALKRVGAKQADGEILLFLDSDVIPDDGWLAHLLGTFAKPDIPVVFGQPYVAPTNVYSRAFALGWIYEPRDESGRLVKYHKLFPNNTAFRADVYHQTGFKPIGSRSRGASSQLCDELASRGFSVWQNSNACVDHPAPCGLHHFVVRALAHGRDYYMRRSEQRHIGGLATSLGIGASRLGRSYQKTFRDGRRVGIKFWQVPVVLSILTTFYGIWFVGGCMTHISPSGMSRRFQV